MKLISSGVSLDISDLCRNIDEVRLILEFREALKEGLNQ